MRRRSSASFRYEQQFWAAGYQRIAGVDEVGRGPLAGPVVAAAVILPARLRAPWLRHVADSKLLTPDQRDDLYARITRVALAWHVCVVDVARIDRVNILNATKEAMAGALAALEPEPDLVLLDALTLPQVLIPQTALIDGDAISRSIAAASIVAKVTRDRLMEAAAREYPGYGFERHKGYAAPEHVEALMRLGPCPLHRRSFEPVRLAEQGQLARAWFDRAWETIEQDA